MKWSVFEISGNALAGYERLLAIVADDDVLDAEAFDGAVVSHASM